MTLTGAEGQRRGRLAEALGRHGADVLLVSAPANIRYLTGFAGSSGLLLIAADGEHAFLTDFRYATVAAELMPTGVRRLIATDLLAALPDALPSAGGVLAFDEHHLTVSAHERAAARLGAGWELVQGGGLVEELRAVKDATEVQRIRAAAALIDEVFGWMLDRGVRGREERELASDLEHEMRRRGARGPSFPSIVASGSHGALPHAEPRAESIASGALLTVDMGAELDGYCSDCTRTFAVGPVSERASEIHALVLEAQLAGLAALRPGRSGREVDAAARAVIEAAGHEEHFGHGLGHGVGLEIHEAPRLSRTAAEAPLRAGNVVTVEPGVYLPGELGVRIEDLLVVSDEGYERLSEFPKELIVAD